MNLSAVTTAGAYVSVLRQHRNGRWGLGRHSPVTPENPLVEEDAMPGAWREAGGREEGNGWWRDMGGEGRRERERE